MKAGVFSASGRTKELKINRACMRTKRSLIQTKLLYLAVSILTLQPWTTFTQPVTKVAAAGHHSMFLKSDGSLWVMGYNRYGQLGDGTFNPTNPPEQIVASNVTAIAAGDDHSLFLKSDGSLWAMGYNSYGQLGDGTFNNAPTGPSRLWPATSRRLPPETATACFSRATAACGPWATTVMASWATALTTTLTGPSRLWPATSRRLPQEMSTACFSRATAVCGAWATTAMASWATALTTAPTGPSMIVASNVTAIAAGYCHSLFLKSDGSLWAMGDNDFGQLGDGTYITIPNQPARADCGQQRHGDCRRRYRLHSLFLKSDGSLWAMGDNSLWPVGRWHLQ